MYGEKMFGSQTLDGAPTAAGLSGIVKFGRGMLGLEEAQGGGKQDGRHAFRVADKGERFTEERDRPRMAGHSQRSDAGW